MNSKRYRSVFVVVVVAVALTLVSAVACASDPPVPAPTAAPEAAPTRQPTLAATPTATPMVSPPTPTATPGPTEPPAPPTNTPAPTFTPQPKPTVTPEPTPTRTPSPTLTPRPTSTLAPPSPIAGLENEQWIEENEPQLASVIKGLPWVVDGVSDLERDAVQQLLWITWVEKEHAWNLVDTPWLKDGPDAYEIEAIERLNWTTQTSPELGDALWEAAWMQDGITADEVTVMENLNWVAQPADASHRADAIQMAISILSMPFLKAVDSWDAMAMRSLQKLEYQNTVDYLDIMSHPKLGDGITDEEARMVALLGGTYSYRPESGDVLLRGTGVYWEELTVTSPMSGDVYLAVVRIRDQATHSMDFLEHSVRTIEEFMSVGLPTTYIALLYDDAVFPGSGGTNFGTHMAMQLLYDVENGHWWGYTPFVIAHEVAHYYWGGDNQDWIDEGAAEILASISEYARDETPIDVTNNPCASAKTIGELEAMDPEQLGTRGFNCNYSLGEQIFLDLYNSLGEETFRPGFRNLYLKSLAEDYSDDCEGTDLGICHLVAAFKADVSEADAAKVDEIVARWYGPVP